MKRLLILVVALGGCARAPEPGHFIPAIAAGVGLQVISAEAAPVTPDVPANGVCPACRGKGKVGDGTVMVDCQRCGGDGRIDDGRARPDHNAGSETETTENTEEKREERAEITWLVGDDQYGPAVKLARESNRMVLVDVAPDWCGPCKLLTATLSRPEVIERLSREYVLLRIQDGKAYRAFNFANGDVPRIALVKGGIYRDFTPRGDSTPEQIYRQLDETRDALERRLARDTK